MELKKKEKKEKEEEEEREEEEREEEEREEEDDEAMFALPIYHNILPVTISKSHHTEEDYNTSNQKKRTHSVTDLSIYLFDYLSLSIYI